MIRFTVIPKKPFGTWQFGKLGVLVNFIIQKLKSKHVVCLSFSGEKIHFAESSGPKYVWKIAISLYFYLRIDVNPLRLHVSLRDMQHCTWFCAKLVEKTLPLHSLPNTHVKWASSNCYWLQIVKKLQENVKGSKCICERIHSNMIVTFFASN